MLHVVDSLCQAFTSFPTSQQKLLYWAFPETITATSVIEKYRVGFFFFFQFERHSHECETAIQLQILVHSDKLSFHEFLIEIKKECLKFFFIPVNIDFSVNKFMFLSELHMEVAVIWNIFEAYSFTIWSENCYSN